MIRVASVPACHPYVAAITDPDSVAVLPDPAPRRIDVPGQWWPPRWLEPAYLRRHLDEIDVLHVHFGFDAIPVADLKAVCDIVAAHHIPMVLTVHDLHNPHFADTTAHLDKLDVLVPAATQLITLTDGAARMIARRWRRHPVVVPHPHLLPLGQVGAPRVCRETPVVAVHAKSLRANIDPWTALNILGDAGLDVALRLDLDEDAFASANAPQDMPDRLAHLVSRGVKVCVHPPFSDAELGRYLHEIDVLVLPYLFGTHSGWVEICHDAKVVAVVPDCGHFAEQHDVPVFALDTSGFSRTSLLSATAAAVEHVRKDDGADDQSRRTCRAAQSRLVRDRHVDIYRAVSGFRSGIRPIAGSARAPRPHRRCV